MQNEIVNHLILQNSRKLQNNWNFVLDKLKEYNNVLVDSVVLEKEVSVTFNTVKNEVTVLFTPNVYKKYQTILKSPSVTTSLDNKILLESQAKDMTKLLSETYSERIVKNIKAIEKIRGEVKLDIAKYEKMSKSFPKVDRLNIIQRLAEKGSNWKGHTYSYKELANMNRGISKYIENKVQYDKYELNYDEYISKGETPFKTKRRWISSGMPNSRHSAMDGEIVSLKEPFEVKNDINGYVDYLMFPGDFNNDTNGCSNVCNCACGVAYV